MLESARPKRNPRTGDPLRNLGITKKAHIMFLEMCVNSGKEEEKEREEEEEEGASW